MNLHEYQANNLLRIANIPVPDSKAYDTKEQVLSAIKQLDKNNKWVIKVQAHTGGRGKAGGVLITNEIEKVEEFCDKWIGNKIVTYQTGPEGLPVHKILVGPQTSFKRELYFSLLFDTSANKIVCICSKEGGVEIEKTATENPNAICKVNIDPNGIIYNYQVNLIAKALELKLEQKQQIKEMLKNFIKLFLEKDLSLIEINPMVETTNGKIICLDAKLNVDENSNFRQKELFDLEDKSQVNQKELEAKVADLSYVAVKGNIGCLVNGAGLAMATMDMIKLKGGEPANFLDVGGTADQNRVTKALKIITSDKNVKVIFVNIFGGIVKCDLIADGIIGAVQEIGDSIPLVVRLQGTRSIEAKEKLAKVKLNIYSEEDLAMAAEKAAQLAQ